MAEELHIPDDWQAAIDTIGAEGFARVVVIGATDTGNSSFVTLFWGRRFSPRYEGEEERMVAEALAAFERGG